MLPRGPNDIAYSADLGQWLVTGQSPVELPTDDISTVMTASSLAGPWTEQVSPMDNAAAGLGYAFLYPGGAKALWISDLSLWVIVGIGPPPTAPVTQGWVLGSVRWA